MAVPRPAIPAFIAAIRPVDRVAVNKAQRRDHKPAGARQTPLEVGVIGQRIKINPGGLAQHKLIVDAKTRAGNSAVDRLTDGEIITCIGYRLNIETVARGTRGIHRAFNKQIIGSIGGQRHCRQARTHWPLANNIALRIRQHPVAVILRRGWRITQQVEGEHVACGGRELVNIGRVGRVQFAINFRTGCNTGAAADVLQIETEVPRIAVSAEYAQRIGSRLEIKKGRRKLVVQRVAVGKIGIACAGHYGPIRPGQRPVKVGVIRQRVKINQGFGAEGKLVVDLRARRRDRTINGRARHQALRGRLRRKGQGIIAAIVTPGGNDNRIVACIRQCGQRCRRAATVKPRRQDEISVGIDQGHICTANLILLPGPRQSEIAPGRTTELQYLGSRASGHITRHRATRSNRYRLTQIKYLKSKIDPGLCAAEHDGIIACGQTDKVRRGILPKTLETPARNRTIGIEHLKADRRGGVLQRLNIDQRLPGKAKVVYILLRRVGQIPVNFAVQVDCSPLWQGEGNISFRSNHKAVGQGHGQTSGAASGLHDEGIRASACQRNRLRRARQRTAATGNIAPAVKNVPTGITTIDLLRLELDLIADPGRELIGIDIIGRGKLIGNRRPHIDRGRLSQIDQAKAVVAGGTARAINIQGVLPGLQIHDATGRGNARLRGDGPAGSGQRPVQPAVWRQRIKNDLGIGIQCKHIRFGFARRVDGAGDQGCQQAAVAREQYPGLQSLHPVAAGRTGFMAGAGRWRSAIGDVPGQGLDTKQTAANGRQYGLEYFFHDYPLESLNNQKKALRQYHCPASVCAPRG